MFIVMGATGNVGAAVANELLNRGEEVTILTRRPEGAGAWAGRGATVAQADANDIGSLKEAFRKGKRAFLLNPPGDRRGDTDKTERRTIANILAALEGSNLDMVVAASTYGAQPGEAIGDLSTLWHLEEGLRSQSIPAAINRGAYYMSNWLGFADAIRETGVLPSLFPADTEMPMVAPADLGRAAAARLLGPADDTTVRHIEGPARYTSQNVADAFARALGRQVEVDVASRETWEAGFKSIGFSPEAAGAYARMTAVSLDKGFDAPASPSRGATDLDTFIAAAVAQS